MGNLDLDASLRSALMEALREDWEQILDREDAPVMSLRQRRRLRKMLKDPRGYYRHYFRGGRETPEGGARAFACPNEVRIRKKHILRLVMAAIVAALLAGSALAYSLTGGEFFTRLFGYFGQELGLDTGVADMSQLADMGCAKLGTILETDELRFELLDAVSGGYMSMVALRVTCKQTDEVVENDEDGSCWQTEFASIDGTLTDDTSIADAGYGCSYRYVDDEMGLKPNQFYLIFNTNSAEPVRAGTYTLELHDLIKSADGGRQTVLSTGDWTLEIPLEDGGKYTRTVTCGETYPIGSADYILERVQYSPLSMNLYFSSDSSDERFGKSFTDYSVTLKDGKVLDRPWFCCGIGSGSDASGTTAHVTLEFNAPLDVDQIASVQFSGNSVDLAGWK